jgi:glycosyltransferase involved in cell wall biosynthesis
VLVVAARFPSPIQPWLLNQIVQVRRHGGAVTIVADGPEGTSYPVIVDRLKLLDDTLYLPASKPLELLRGLSTLVLPGAVGRSARAGARRILASDRKPTPWRARTKELARSRLLDRDVDIIHAHSLTHSFEFLHVSEILDVPMVLTFHGHTPAGVGMLAEPKRERLFAGIDGALVNTEFARSQLEAIGCPGQKIRILPQGIRMADYPYRPRPHPGRGNVQLLSVCRLQPDKGLRYSIEAVHDLVSRGYRIDYTIVGGGPEEASLHRLVDELGRSDQIRFTGRVTDERLAQLYGNAHVFVLPSLSNESGDHTETQGVVLQEAQASGVIVTASRVGGIPECVDDGESAFLFPDRDATALAGVIEHVLSSPESWRKWQDAARCRVQERFDIDELGRRLMEFYATTRAKRGAVR